MTLSPERLAANRANALKSTGPKTAEGKAISRRNGLKHGMTGEGMALSNEDAAEVERRFANFEAEMAPKTELGRALAQRTAMLTVRLERCYRNESARLTVAVDSALRRYDDGRIAELEAQMDGLEKDPGTNAWRLQSSRQGVEYTIRAWHALKMDLMHPDRKVWSTNHWQQAEGLMGRRTTDLPRSRIGMLSRALWHDFSALDPQEATGLSDQGKYEYARDRMAEIIDERIAILDKLAASFDDGAAARARAASTDIALFDDSKESVLARKYEAATERSLFRTLREFREVEAEAAAKPVEVEVTPETAEGCGELGSSLSTANPAVIVDETPAPSDDRGAVPGRFAGPGPAVSGPDPARSGPG